MLTTIAARNRIYRLSLPAILLTCAASCMGFMSPTSLADPLVEAIERSDFAEAKRLIEMGLWSEKVFWSSTTTPLCFHC